MVELPGKTIPDPETPGPLPPPASTPAPTPSTSSSSGSTASTPTSTSTSPVTTGSGSSVKDYNDEDPESRFLGIAGHPEVWKDASGKMYIVHFAEGTDPPVPLLYETTMEALEGFFGEGVDVKFDRELSAEELTSTGAVRFGTTDNLDDSEGDPWLGFLDRMERYAEVSAWGDDDEILALIGGAYLEGRELEPWELKTTDWWQEHNEQERAWLELSVGDPASAERKLEDDKLYVAGLFEKIGAEGNDQALIDWIARRYSTGSWSEAYLIKQIEAVTSGWSDVDEDLDTFMSEGGYEGATSEQNYARVKDLWSSWLGPAYSPTDAQVAEWAAKIRNTADGEDSLIEMLKGQRMALFPEYEDETLKWDDIAGPWKNMAASVWGVPVDETDPRFQEIVRMNNANEAQKKMREIGLSEGYERTRQAMSDGMGRAMTRNVRGAV
ncbi:MAG: hypothetical protein ABFR89_02525 [Actinomycetota bacterium]